MEQIELYELYFDKTYVVSFPLAMSKKEIDRSMEAIETLWKKNNAKGTMLMMLNGVSMEEYKVGVKRNQ